MKKMVKHAKSGIHENNFLRFYEVMGYPIPRDEDFFSFGKGKKICGSKTFFSDSSFSRDVKNDYMDEYLEFISKWSFLYRNFPFVKEIYLANSISFNALNSSSDIDIFVISKGKRIWIARLFMSFIMLLFRIKRSGNKSAKRFCLSFFVDEYNKNLESLLLDEKDIYLPYWVIHLVPLYAEISPSIYESNFWVKNYLPGYSGEQMIFLGNSCYFGKGRLKIFFEMILGGKFGDFFEKFVQKFWGMRISKIMKKNPVLHEGVVVEKGILKFYHDRRKHYSKLFFSGDNFLL